MNLTLKQALKYSTSDINRFLPLLSEGGVHTQAGHITRLAAADAFEEAGREAEARLLRSQNPIYTWRGAVYHAQGNPQGAENFADIHEQHHFRYTPNPNVNGEVSLEDSVPVSSVTDPAVSKEVREHAKHYYHSNFSSSLERYPRRHSRLLFNYTTPHSDGEQYPDYVDLWPNMTDAEALNLFHEVAQQVGRFTLVADPQGKVTVDRDTHHWGQPAGLQEGEQ